MTASTAVLPMDLKEFISVPDRKRRLAEATSKSEGYLWQIATAWRGKRVSAELALQIERATAEIGPEAVPKEGLRPDIFGPLPVVNAGSEQAA